MSWNSEPKAEHKNGRLEIKLKRKKKHHKTSMSLGKISCDNTLYDWGAYLSKSIK